MKKIFLALFVFVLFTLIACGTSEEVPTPIPQQEEEQVSVTKAQFCVPIERDDIDFSVLNDVRSLVERESVFTETAQDPELLLRGALGAVFNYLGVANNQIPEWATAIVDEELAKNPKRPDFSILNEVYQGLLWGPLRDSSYREDLIKESVRGTIGTFKNASRSEELIEASVRGVVNSLGENPKYSDLMNPVFREGLIEASVRRVVDAFYNPSPEDSLYVDEAPIEASVRGAFDTLVRSAISLQDPQYSDLQDPSRREELIEVSVRGVVDALGDPFASYMTAEAWKSGAADNSGRYRGIGVTVQQGERGIGIGSVFDGSPAERAGLKAGDVILGVNDLSTERCSVSQFILRVQTLENPTMNLMVERESLTSTKKDILPITVTLEQIKRLLLGTYPGIELPGDRGNTIDNLPYRCNGDSIEASLPCPFTDGDKDGIPDVLYIRIHGFDDQMAVDLEYFLSNTNLAPFKGVVVDVRSNPGGLVSTTISAVDFFLPTNDVIYTNRSANGVIMTTRSNKVTYLPSDTPLVILMNRDSFSGAELFAAALQDHGRAVIVNRDERSGGKGSVNQHFTLRNGDYGALYVSISMWLTPNGEVIESQDLDNDGYYEIGGVRPDIHVPWSDEDFTMNSQDVNYDPTLQAALDYIQEHAVYLVSTD